MTFLLFAMALPSRPLAEFLDPPSRELLEVLFERLPLGVGAAHVVEDGLGHVDGMAAASQAVREVEPLVFGTVGVAAALGSAAGQLDLRERPLHHRPELLEIGGEGLGLAGHGHLLYLL
jgi:hypothetical protein